VIIGDLTVTQQGFSEMTSLTTQFAVAKMDGILGLGYPAISQNKLTPLMVNLKTQGLIDNNVVTFALAHTGETSVMVIGGEDPSLRTEDFAWQPVTQQAYWMIDIDAIKLNGNIIASNLKGIVDTGTSLMVATQAILGDITKISISEDCSTDVTQLPLIVFTLQGKDYTLQGSD